MTLKFVACLLVATLVSTVIAVPYRKPEFAEFTGEVKKGKFEGKLCYKTFWKKGKDFI